MSSWSARSAASSNAVAVQGNYVYLGLGRRLVIMNVANPANPIIVGQTALLPSFVRDVAVAGSYAYVADLDSGLWVIDVANPAAPVEVGAYDTPEYAWGVAVAGSVRLRRRWQQWAAGHRRGQPGRTGRGRRLRHAGARLRRGRGGQLRLRRR